MIRAKTILVALAVAAVSVGLQFGMKTIVPDSALRILLQTAACNVMIAVSLNIINGMAGQFSIGHAGFVALGAYAAAVTSAYMHNVMWPDQLAPLIWDNEGQGFVRSLIVMPVALIAAMGVAGLFGFLVGLPSLRLKGDYLAIVTLGFAEIVRLVFMTASVGGKETPGEAWGAVKGIGSFFHAINVSISSLGGANGYMGIGGNGAPTYAGPFWIFGMAFLVFILAWRIKFSGWGRALRALREDEIAAAAVGVDPTRYKVTSFVLAAMGAGVAGACMALMRDGVGIVQPGNYDFAMSFDAITMVILGGSGSVTGAVLGGIFVTLTIKGIEFIQSAGAVQSLKTVFPGLDLNALRMILYATVLIALMILRPEGVLGERELGQKKRAPKTGPPAPGAPTRTKATVKA